MFNETDEVPQYSVVIIDEAKSDLANLADFYWDSDGEDSAERFYGAADSLIDSLAFWPRANAMWEDDDTIRRVNFSKHKVSIIYRISDSYLEVIAVAAFHTMSDPQRIRALVESRTKIAEQLRSNSEDSLNLA